MNANATSILETSRRDFIKAGAALTGGLMLGFSVVSQRSGCNRTCERGARSPDARA